MKVATGVCYVSKSVNAMNPLLSTKHNLHTTNYCTRQLFYQLSNCSWADTDTFMKALNITHWQRRRRSTRQIAVPQNPSWSWDLDCWTWQLHSHKCSWLQCHSISHNESDHWWLVGLHFAFSALTLLAGRQEEHPACKNWVMRCWCGYLSGVRCRLFAYGPADATAIPKPRHLLRHLNPDWFYLSGTGLPRLSWKRGR